MRRAWWLALALWACDDAGQGGAVDGAPPDGAVDAVMDARPADAEVGDAADVAPPDLGRPDRGPDVIPPSVRVEITLDGAAAEGVRVTQGGTERWALTDADGVIARFDLDRSVVGEVTLVASHPQARQRSAWIFPSFRGPARIPLERYGPDDPSYRFQDPGEPERRTTTAQCGHCHLRINDAWYASPHRTAARNPVVHDLYSGTASGLDQVGCEAAGGAWAEGRLPGGGRGPRCYLGDGALATVNADCAPGAPCDAPADAAGCADCHAPGMDGQLGGQDLLDAGDRAYAYGVFCDVCHRVDEVVPDAPPGVAGRLRLTRPSDPGPITLGAGGKRPLTFGPSHDSPNPRMGSVQRDHYRDGSLCLGCHEYEHGALVPGTALDPARWPGGTFPVQSTFSEWQASVYGGTTPCNACHMPPDPRAANGADLQAFPLAEVGIQGGWYRPPGSVRQHAWYGPRQPESQMLERAAALTVQVRREAGALVAAVGVRNVGAGHGLPTGEPMRHLLLVVDATCDGAPLRATGGDALPDYAGHAASQGADGDWRRWPGAAVGDVIRVVRRPGAWRDDPATGPFADFTPAQKGLAVEQVAGQATVTAVEDGAVTLDGALPAGDVAYRIRPGGQAAGLAGAAGHGFARVTLGADGRRMVPHFRAVDLASDNRLPPLAQVTTQHTFAVAEACQAPRVRARLLYRPYPRWLARQRGWAMPDRVIAEVAR